MFKTARSVSICRLVKYDIGSPAARKLFFATDWCRHCFIGHFPKSEKSWTLPVFWSMSTLEQRQYKNDSIQSKVIPTLNLPQFFTTYTMREKGVNFKIGIIFDWMESFLFCLCSSISHFLPNDSLRLQTIWSPKLWEISFLIWGLDGISKRVTS